MNNFLSEYSILIVTWLKVAFIVIRGHWIGSDLIRFEEVLNGAIVRRKRSQLDCPNQISKRTLHGFITTT